MKSEHANPIWNLNFRGDTTGFPLLWLHGFMGSSNDWEELVREHFSDYCNILVDLPGHGKSHLSETVAYQTLLLDLFNQILSAGFRQFIPIGYSMGGRIALHLHANYPDNIPALVGLSTAPGLKTDSERQERIVSDTKLMDQLEQVGFKNFLKEWYGLALFQSIAKNETLLKSLKKSRSKNKPDQLRRSLEALGTGAMPSLWKHLAGMDLPMLLLSGELDIKYCEINADMLANLPQAEHQQIKSADHAFHLEKPLDTAPLIRQFLRQVI